MQAAQKQLIEEQDQHLEEIHQIAERLKAGGKNINEELDKQGVIIEDLNQQVESTTNKMNFVQAKLSKLLKTNGMHRLT